MDVKSVMTHQRRRIDERSEVAQSPDGVHRQEVHTRTSRFDGLVFVRGLMPNATGP